VQNSRRIHVDEKTRQAYEWALNQTHQSVAARYARALAEYIRDSVPEQEVQGEESELHKPMATIRGEFTGEATLREIVCEVEDIVGMRAAAWDTVDPEEVAAAFAYSIRATHANDRVPITTKQKEGK
jgi:hypothetical protein